MSVASAEISAKTQSKAVLVALLAVAIFINYVDRGNIATAAPLLKGEFSLSNAEVGTLISAFFWVYSPAQLLAAWAVQRMNAYRALALGLLLWSLATMLSGFANGFAMLLGLRILLGLGESAGFPASSALLARHLPHHRLGFANALISAGLTLGPSVGTLLGGLLLAQAGWRPLFFVFGMVSLLWLPAWFLGTRAHAAEAALAEPAPGPLLAELLRRKELWGTAIGHFASNYAYYLVLSWLPIYLVKTHGFSLSEMARLGGIVYALAAATAILGGLLGDRLIAQGAGATLVRKGTICTGTALGIVSMAAVSIGTSTLAIAGLLLFGIATGLVSFNLFAISQTLSGAGAAARWTGVQNCVANVAGIVAPIVTGMIVDRTGEFGMAFLIAAALLVVGLVCWGFVVGRVEPLNWSRSDSWISQSGRRKDA
jgi:MFS family permease